jgi:hypothetical protein
MSGNRSDLSWLVVMRQLARRWLLGLKPKFRVSRIRQKQNFVSCDTLNEFGNRCAGRVFGTDESMIRRWHSRKVEIVTIAAASTCPARTRLHMARFRKVCPRLGYKAARRRTGKKKINYNATKQYLKTSLQENYYRK